MKIALYTDVHVSEFSSIVRSIGNKYSTRLENIIHSINWAEETAEKYSCDEIVCLGDFFDKPDLKSIELTALKEIKWSKLPHTFLVGNHEASNKSLQFNSTWTLLGHGFNLIDEPKIVEYSNVVLVFIPYIVETERKQLKDYIPETNKKVIVFSHNDIAGLQYGMFKSTEGFSIDEIEKDCTLFLNGHLHNGEQFCKNGFNLGNLTGQNFNENALKYTHSMFILDTENGTIDSIENPFALNFYQFEINNITDIEKLREIKGNSVLQVKYKEELSQEVTKVIDSLKNNIIASRLTLTRNVEESSEDMSTELRNESYLTQFYNFSIEKLGNSNILIEELNKVMQ